MRKSVLLLFIGLFTHSLVHGQTQVFFEDFDSGNLQVTTGARAGTGYTLWNDTNFVYTSPNMSYHVRAAQGGTKVYMETDPFSTVGLPYVRLSFNHIAKLNPANGGYLFISTDGGTTWDTITDNNSIYLGDDQTFLNTKSFMQTSHLRLDQNGNPIYPWYHPNLQAVPDNSWWIKETFGLTGLASDVSGSPFTGYPDVRIRFEALFQLAIPGNIPAGWFVDDLEIVADSCEVTPPTVSFDFIPSGPCYPTPPIGGQVEDTSGTYPIGVVAEDDASPYDTGIDSVAVTYRVNNGAWQSMKLPNVAGTNEYKGFIPNLSLGDMVDYYVEAWDLACPSGANANVTQVPDPSTTSGFHTFWIDSAPPIKCGAPVCNAFPNIIQIDSSWTEDFEGNDWVAGNGSGNLRGAFPNHTETRWYVQPLSSDPFGWSVRTGATPTQYTGPSGDHTTRNTGGGGKYLYMESSEQPPSPPFTFFNTPCIDLTQVSGCYALEFYYHMFGQDISLLWVDVDTGSTGGAWTQGYFEISDEQQQSGSDPWKKAMVSLEDFTGSIIRLRFLALNNTFNGSNTKNDIAIDDLRIFEPTNVEMEALDHSMPVNGYCAYANEPVTISVRNNSCPLAQDIPVAYQINNGTIWRDTIYGANLSLGDDTIDYVFDKAADLSGIGTYQIKVWVEASGETEPGNDTIYGPVIHHNPLITNFPYVEDFEGAAPGTQNLNNSDFVFEDGLNPDFFWQVDSQMTPTRNTGPFSGFYWGGKYLYTESNSASGNVSTYMRSLCFDLSGMSNPTLDFLFHGNAEDFEKLEIEVSRGDENIDQWTKAGSSVLPWGNASELDDWKLHRVNLSPFVNATNQSVKIRFKATRKGPAGDRTDFAIDNLTVYDLIPNDAGAFSMTNPRLSGTLNHSLTPEVMVANYGSSPLTNFTVHMDITPLCGSNPQTNSYSQTFTPTTGIAPGTVQQVTMNSANVTWPVGEAEVRIYTSVSGDSHNFNDTISRHITGIGTYDIPYLNDFDTCDYAADGFFAVGGLQQWELGTPTFGFGAHSSPNAWATNLDGPFLTGTTELLQAVFIENFDTINNAELRFYQSHNFGGSSGSSFNAAGNVLWRDGGQWSILGGDRVGLPGTGSSGVGVNWYDGPNGDLNIDLFNNQPGWHGSNSGSYDYTMYPLNRFNAQPNPLILRYQFKSSASGNANAGWAIDDFEVYVPPQNSVSPIGVFTEDPLPFPNQAHTLVIRVRNTGEKVVSEYNVEVEIDNTPIGTDHVNVNPSLIKNDVHVDTFSTDWPAGLAGPGHHTVCITTSRPSNKQDNKPVDDRNCFTIQILREIDLTSTGDSSFCDGFEDAQSEWLPKNSANLRSTVSSWEHGVPIQVDSAHGGTQVWMTGLDSNYKSMDASGLYSPIFIVDSGQAFKMDFWHWFKTEKYHDGGNVEYSYDGGATWLPFGWANPFKDNWHNTHFVTALDKIRSGWTDSSATWINSFFTLAFEQDLKVVFRYRFGADYSLQDAGWAIDDFCFSKTDTAEIIIGDEEYQLPDQVIIGELSPNPSSDWSQLSFHFPSSEKMSVKVYNVVGQLIESSENYYEPGVHQLDFNTTTWKNGVYLINLEYDGQSVTKKLVVSH